MPESEKGAGEDRPAIEWKGFKALPGGPVMAPEAKKWGGGKL